MDQQTTGISKRVTPARDDSRSIDEIRQDIENTRNEITDTVDLLGEKLKETFDWRSYLTQYPVVAVGGATLLGFYLGRKLFARKRVSDTDQLVRNLIHTATNALQPRKAEKPLMLTLLTMGGKYLLDTYQQHQQELAEQQHQQQQLEQLQALGLLQQQQQFAGQQNQFVEHQEHVSTPTNNPSTGNPGVGYHRVAGRDF